jgi:VanZ family protein
MQKVNLIENSNRAIYYKPLKYIGLYVYLGYLAVCLTVYVCLMPSPPDTSDIQFGDKIVHMIGYFCLFLWFAQIYHRRHYWRPIAGLILLGITIEFAQGFTAYRSFEIADMFANTSGVLLGWLVSATPVSFLFVKLESILIKR